jgi:Mn-dependent DtxR family transcriptional regulator
MNREQLDKINGLLNRIAKMEEILAIKSDKLRISEFVDVQYRHIEITCIGEHKTHEVIVERELLETAFTEYLNLCKSALRGWGYED